MYKKAIIFIPHLILTIYATWGIFHNAKTKDSPWVGGMFGMYSSSTHYSDRRIILRVQNLKGEFLTKTLEKNIYLKNQRHKKILFEFHAAPTRVSHKEVIKLINELVLKEKLILKKIELWGPEFDPHTHVASWELAV